MTKVAFIIPSYFSKVNSSEYKSLGQVFRAKGYAVKYIQITWQNKTMSDYISQFKAFYSKNCGDQNVVFGFSFGAMIALLSARELNPDCLLLASLSPYFAEDLKDLAHTDIKAIGKKRFEDLRGYSLQAATKNLDIPTYLFYGDIELLEVQKRVIDTHKRLSNSKLIKVKRAEHDISDNDYFTAVKQVIETL